MPISPQDAMVLREDERKAVQVFARDIDRLLADRFDGANAVDIPTTELDMREISEITSRVAEELARQYQAVGWGKVEFIRDNEERRDNVGSAYTVLRDRFRFHP